MRLSRRVVGAALVLAGSLGLGTSAVGPSTVVAAAESASDGPYAGTASADGLRLSYEVKGFLLTDRFVDSGAPVAQASVNSLESVGFASAPYPGDTVITAPGLVGGAAGTPLPDYPLVASSQYPGREEQRIDEGVVRLSSTSTSSSSTASGAAGGPDDESASLGTSLATAEVVHDETNGAVTSTASTSAEAFAVADVLRIGRVASMAEVVDSPDGDPDRQASLDVGGVTIAGQTVALTENGLALPGSSTPLPDGSPLHEALADHGIEVRYLAAEQTRDGVVAPGVEVRVTHPIPTAPSPAVAVYRFGRASASATGGMGSLTVDVAGGLGDVSGGTGGGDLGSVVGPSDATAGLVSPAPATSARPAPDASAGTALAPERAEAVPIAAATPQWAKSWTMAFYLVIVLSGLMIVSGAQLIRLLGVRMPWTS